MTQRRRLTDTFIASLRPQPVSGSRERARYEFFDTEVRQLSIRISHTGAKTFLLRARWPGNGSNHPAQRAVGAADIGIAEARKLARAWLNQVADGLDPADDKRRRRKEEKVRREAERRAAGNTFENATVLYFKSPAHQRKRSRDRVEQRIGNHLVPVWGARPIGDVTKHDVRELLTAVAERALEKGGSGRFAHSLADDGKALFAFAAAERSDRAQSIRGAAARGHAADQAPRRTHARPARNPGAVGRGGTHRRVRASVPAAAALRAPFA